MKVVSIIMALVLSSALVLALVLPFIIGGGSGK